MATLQRFAASVPADVSPVWCLEFSHSTFAAPLRRAWWPSDWSVVIDGATVVFTNATDAGGWSSPQPTVDDSGIATRTLSIDDVDLTYRNALASTRGDDEAVQCVIRCFASDDSTLMIAEYYDVRDFSGLSSGKLTVTVGTPDIGNQRFGRVKHTLANSPGLRGRAV